MKNHNCEEMCQGACSNCKPKCTEHCKAIAEKNSYCNCKECRDYCSEKCSECKE